MIEICSKSAGPHTHSFCVHPFLLSLSSYTSLELDNPNPGDRKIKALQTSLSARLGRSPQWKESWGIYFSVIRELFNPQYCCIYTHPKHTTGLLKHCHDTLNLLPTDKVPYKLNLRANCNFSFFYFVCSKCAKTHNRGKILFGWKSDREREKIKK